MALINMKRTSLFLLSGGTLPTYPANFLETNEPVIVVPEFSSIETNRLGGALNSRDSTVDTCRTSTTIPLVHNMRSTGAVLTEPPEYGELLKIGGFVETIGADTVTYTNNVGTIPQGSAVAFMDGQKFEMTDGLVANVGMNFTVGQVAQITGELSGYIDSAVPTEEANPTVTLSTEGLLIVSCADLYTIDGTALPVESVVINVNPDIQSLYTMGGANGLKSNYISDYALELVATFYVDSTTFGREAGDIELETYRTLEIQMGLDNTGSLVDGQSVVLTADLGKTSIYSDEVNQDLLRRTVTYRLMNNGDTALTMVHGNVTP